jgi:hypothetical protein
MDVSEPARLSVMITGGDGIIIAGPTRRPSAEPTIDMVGSAQTVVS